jgi:methionine-rich copper-binding protein CopC
MKLRTANCPWIGATPASSQPEPAHEENWFVTPWLTRSRRLPRRSAARIVLRLETLEARNLLDGSAQVLYHPEAILAPGFGRRGVPPTEPVPSDYRDAPPPPGGLPNVLVNDPAEDGASANDTQSETALTLDGSTVIAAYHDSFKAGQSPPHYTGFSRSDDGGQTFVDGGSLPNVSPTTGDAGQPVLAHDNQTHRTYLATLGLTTGVDHATDVYVWRSNDALRTFLAPVDVTRSGASLDKEWLAVDNFSGPGQGNVYLIVRDFGSGNGIYLFHSTDQGATFGPNGGVQIVSGASGNVQGAWVTVGPDHTVYAFWYDATSSTQSIKMRKSTDGGQTFGNPVTVTTLHTTGVNGDLGLGGGFRSNAFPQAVVNPVTGQLYVAYDDKGTATDKADVYFRSSNDGGTTWSAAIDVVDDTTGHDQWQPALAVTPNGNDVGVFWYDRRLDPTNSLIDRFGAIGMVAGGTVTFGPNFRITDTSFPVEIGHDPAVNATYMGDYDTAVADNTGFYVTWGDNRSPSLGHAAYNADVRFTHIPASIAGPSVVSVTPRGATFPPVSTLRVIFDERMNPTTFTPDQFQLTDFHGNRITIRTISPVDDTDQRFDVTFATQSATGIYHYKIGPRIKDQNGNYMDQDGNGIPGEDPEDAYFGTIDIAGPKVIASTPTGNANLPGSVDHVRLTFSEPMDPTTFTFDQVSFTGADGSQIPINDIEPVDSTNNTQFDVSFDPLTVTGAYQMTIGPYILDPYGNAMDQNGNFIPGEIPGDQYMANFGILGPKVTASTPTGNANLPGSVDHVRLTFNESMNPTTFTPDQVSFTDPDGNPVPINDIEPVDGSDNTQFDVSFDPLTVPGAYQMVIGPYILDLNGNAMDQNGNLITGEIPGDQYTARFGVAAPQVIGFARNGPPNQPAASVRVTFNEPMDPTTFTPDQIVSFTDPQGNQIAVTDVEPVDGSNNTQFDISFDTQSLQGTYTLQIAAGILDFFGNALPAPYTGTFVVALTYSAVGYDFESLDIHGLPGTFRVIQYADDLSVPVNLGSHTFNFYGVNYTGNNQLFVSSNGLITFGSENPLSANSDLTTQPSQPAIAVLWSDWIKTSGTDMVEGYFDDANDRLILQFNAIQHYPSSPRGITFQVILYLDTGGAAGDIVFNYVDLDTGDANRNGQTATVGIKNAGNQGMDRLLVSFNQANMLVGSGEAILISTNEGGQPRLHGSRGRPVWETFAAPDSLGVALATVRPAVLAPPSPAFDMAPRFGNRDLTSSALLEPLAARSLDQVFTRPGGGVVAGVRHHHAVVADEIAPLLPDLLRQAGGM